MFTGGNFHPLTAAAHARGDALCPARTPRAVESADDSKNMAASGATEYDIVVHETPFGITFFEGLDIPLVESVSSKGAASVSAGRSGRRVRVGDRLVSINGRDVSQYSTPHVLALLAESSWRLRRAVSSGSNNEDAEVQLRFRAALNDENPLEAKAVGAAVSGNARSLAPSAGEDVPSKLRVTRPEPHKPSEAIHVVAGAVTAQYDHVSLQRERHHHQRSGDVVDKHRTLGGSGVGQPPSSSTQPSPPRASPSRYSAIAHDKQHLEAVHRDNEALEEKVKRERVELERLRAERVREEALRDQALLDKAALLARMQSDGVRAEDLQQAGDGKRDHRHKHRHHHHHRHHTSHHRSHHGSSSDASQRQRLADEDRADEERRRRRQQRHEQKERVRAEAEEQARLQREDDARRRDARAVDGARIAAASPPPAPTVPVDRSGTAAASPSRSSGNAERQRRSSPDAAHRTSGASPQPTARATTSPTRAYGSDNDGRSRSRSGSVGGVGASGLGPMSGTSAVTIVPPPIVPAAALPIASTTTTTTTTTTLPSPAASTSSSKAPLTESQRQRQEVQERELRRLRNSVKKLERYIRDITQVAQFNGDQLPVNLSTDGFNVMASDDDDGNDDDDDDDEEDNGNPVQVCDAGAGAKSEFMYFFALCSLSHLRLSRSRAGSICLRAINCQCTPACCCSGALVPAHVLRVGN